MAKAMLGYVHYFSEQGSEGRSCWAFQDERYIRKNVPSRYCGQCGKDIEEERPRKHSEQLELPGILYCLPGEHEVRIHDELWDYEGFYALENGDVLTIYDKNDPSRVVWFGTIQFDIGINYATATQEGIDHETWEEWFIKHYPARLIPNRPRKVV